MLELGEGGGGGGGGGVAGGGAGGGGRGGGGGGGVDIARDGRDGASVEFVNKTLGC